MTKTHDRYTYRVTWSEEEQEYIGLCMEFPSLSWLDKTPEKAFDGIRRLIGDIVLDMQKNDENIPAPIAIIKLH